MLVTETSVKQIVAAIVPRTQGVQIGYEVRVGLDSTDDEAVWVWVMVPDERLPEFKQEWAGLRDEIRLRVREHVGDPELFVYVRRLVASEVEGSARATPD